MTPETPASATNNELFGLPGYLPTSDERTWALLAHLLTLAGGFIAPLVVMLTKGGESRWVRAHAVECLNFQLTLLIAYVVGVIGTIVFFGVCIMMAAMIGSLVLSIMAGVKAYHGAAYRYPVAIRFIKA